MLHLIPDFSTMTRGQKRSAMGIGVLFFGPFLILMGIQIYNAILLSSVGADVATAQNAWKAEAFALSEQVEPASLKSGPARSAFKLVEQQSKLLPERQLTLTLDVTLGDMRQIQKPSPSMIENARNEAAAATQSVALQECDRLELSLAADCTVISASGQLIGDNAYQYQIRLAYVEKAAFGKTNKTDAYDFVVSKVPVESASDVGRIYVNRSAETREKVYADIASTCQLIRRDVGTCSVTGISLSARLEPGLPMVRMLASATYSSLSRKKS